MAECGAAPNYDVSIVDSYSYDAYGVLLQDGGNFRPGGAQELSYTPQPATKLLYAGEQFDTDAQQYYLRAVFSLVPALAAAVLAISLG